MLPRSKRGGGPQTAEGKAVVALNALSSGAYSALIVLPGENEAEYQALEAQLFADFQPGDLAESALVHELAGLIWKKLRIDRLEHSKLTHLWTRPIELDEFRRYYEGPKCTDSFEWVDQVDLVDASWKTSVMHYRTDVQRARQLDPRTTPIATLNRKCCEVVEMAEGLHRVFKFDSVEDAIRSGEVHLEDGRNQSFWDYAIAQVEFKANQMAWLADNQDAIQAACRAIREQRLIAWVTVDKFRRAHDDLSRAFYKALAELRKHQIWRAQRPIDLIPTSVPPADET